MTPHRKSKKRAARATSPPEVERPTPHVPFLEPDSSDARGLDRGAAPREETLVGTSGSHTPAPDTRAEEPFGELAPGAATEGEDR